MEAMMPDHFVCSVPCHLGLASARPTSDLFAVATLHFASAARSLHAVELESDYSAAAVM